jgi:regulator of replication initiation timing
MKFILINNHLLRYFSLLLLGAIISSSLTVFLIGSQIDQLSLENENLKDKLSTCESENIELQDSLKQRKLVVTSIEPVINFVTNDLTTFDKENYSLKISKVIKEFLSPLIGKEIEKIDHSLVPEVVENRIINIDGRNFKINVKTVIFTQKVTIILNVKEQNPTEN